MCPCTSEGESPKETVRGQIKKIIKTATAEKRVKRQNAAIGFGSKGNTTRRKAQYSLARKKGSSGKHVCEFKRNDNWGTCGANCTFTDKRKRGRGHEVGGPCRERTDREGDYLGRGREDPNWSTKKDRSEP